MSYHQDVYNILNDEYSNFKNSIFNIAFLKIEDGLFKNYIKCILLENNEILYYAIFETKEIAISWVNSEFNGFHILNKLDFYKKKFNIKFLKIKEL